MKYQIYSVVFAFILLNIGYAFASPIVQRLFYSINDDGSVEMSSEQRNQSSIETVTFQRGLRQSPDHARDARERQTIRMTDGPNKGDVVFAYRNTSNSPAYVVEVIQHEPSEFRGHYSYEAQSIRWNDNEIESVTRCYSNLENTTSGIIGFTTERTQINRRCLYLNQAICDGFRESIGRVLGNEQTGDLRRDRATAYEKINSCVATLESFSAMSFGVNESARAAAESEIEDLSGILASEISSRYRGIRFTVADTNSLNTRDSERSTDALRDLRQTILPRLTEQLSDLEYYSNYCDQVFGRASSSRTTQARGSTGAADR